LIPGVGKGLNKPFNSGEPSDGLWSEEKKRIYQQWDSFDVSGVGPSGTTDFVSFPIFHEPFIENPTWVLDTNSSTNITGITVTNAGDNCSTLRVQPGTTAGNAVATFPTTPGTQPGQDIYTFTGEFDIIGYAASFMDTPTAP